MATGNGKQIFLTGASGYVGSVITEIAVANGYVVHGLSRSESADERIRRFGGVPVRGDLNSHDVLSQESHKADIVIHLATSYDLSVPSYDDVFPSDKAALDTIAKPMEGTNKPLVVTSGTLIVAVDPTGDYALSVKDKGIRITAIRLAPFVYGRGGSGVKLFMNMSLQSGGVMCVDNGTNRTTVVHVDDAARLYLLVAENAKAGEIYNASSATDVTAREMSEGIAEALGLPIRSLTRAEAVARFGETLSRFLTAENRASGAKARNELGWEPKEIGILEEIKKGLYTY
ncbi:alcohol dehydrogenase protein [Rutstroemia sp. NJR-2017a BBW]|nr:alcohol dehydrogenase protein [Rutstroemia sp. NJR-2017a BBW]